MRIAIVLTVLSALCGCVGTAAPTRHRGTRLQCSDEPIDIPTFWLSPGSVVVRADRLGRLTPTQDDPLADVVARLCRLPASSQPSRLVTVNVRLEWEP